jgi:hypothetical protein
MISLPVAIVVWASGISAAAGLRVHQAQRVDGPPAATGLGDVSEGEVMNGFTDGATGERAAVQTLAAAFYDEGRLYFLVECLEPNMDGLVAKIEDAGEGKDAYVFSDDCVEIFISPSGSEEEYYHFVANALGARYDEKVKDPSWAADWSVAAGSGEHCWTLAIAIPFSALGEGPSRGAVWWINVSRQRHAAGELELSSWSDTRENFHDVSRFGRLIFDDDYAACLTRYITEPWERRVPPLTERAKIATVASQRLAERLAALERDLRPVRRAAEGKPPAKSLAKFARLLEKGEGALRMLAEAEAELNEAVASIETAQAMRRLARPGQKLLAYSVRAITNRKILPTPQPPESVSRTISMRACQGEYEPASFVVYPLEDTVCLEVTATDLKGREGSIDAGAVDVRAVKCWYQSGGTGRFPINRGLRLLTPELLLKDDDLVRVDYEEKQNYVKLAFPDGTQKWLWVSSSETTPEEKDVSVEAQPIRDARALQPATIEKATAKQFWITVQVPERARWGKYEGAIHLRSGGELLDTLRLELEVLPFDLEPNHLESSMYFHWGINLDVEGAGTVQHRTRSLAQYRAELENLLAHGVDNPTMGLAFDTGLLPTALKIRQEVGMKNDHLYYLYARTSTPLEQIKEIIEIAQQFGFEEVYFYARDEAKGEDLTKQRPIWERVHEAGGKVFVAGIPASWHSRPGNFPLVGDLQDLLVCYGDPSKEEAALWHSKGHKIFCYANPQSGIEEPETYRRNFGLLLDANDYDGGMTYIFYHGWNDFSGKRYRQHNFVYPTADGLIDTIQWEGYREGTDDLRYLATLRKAIREAKQAGGDSAEAAQAQAFIETMDVTGDLYGLREEMIRWILTLTQPQH